MNVHELAEKYGPEADLDYVIGDLILHRSNHKKNRIYKCSGDIFEDLDLSGLLAKERFYVLLLDNKYRRIKLEPVSVGTMNQSLVHPREVFHAAVSVSAAAMVLIHNHPSGDPEPSSQDFDITKRLVQAAEIIGINVLDHIIIGVESYYSFVDEGVMPT